MYVWIHLHANLRQPRSIWVRRGSQYIPIADHNQTLRCGGTADTQGSKIALLGLVPMLKAATSSLSQLDLAIIHSYLTDIDGVTLISQPSLLSTLAAVIPVSRY
jgi:hypothetical protein